MQQRTEKSKSSNIKIRRVKMNISITIYKEKKKKDFRMVILPSGRNKIGLIQVKDYGIISYLNKKDSKKIGELIFWVLNESDNVVV